MTIKDTQDLISAWERKFGRGGVTAASLCDKAAELAATAVPDGMDDRIASVVWDAFALADSLGIDLTEALIDRLERKNAELKCIRER